MLAQELVPAVSRSPFCSGAQCSQRHRPSFPLQATTPRAAEPASVTTLSCSTSSGPRRLRDLRQDASERHRAGARRARHRHRDETPRFATGSRHCVRKTSKTAAAALATDWRPCSSTRSLALYSTGLLPTVAPLRSEVTSEQGVTLELA